VLARRFTAWPLQSPTFQERLVEWCSIEGDEQASCTEEQQNEEILMMEMVYLLYVKPDIDALSERVARCMQTPLQTDVDDVCRFVDSLLPGERDSDEGASKGRLRIPVDGKMDGRAKSHRDRYDFIIANLYPQLGSWSSNKSLDAEKLDWKSLKRHLSPIAIVDPCVDSFTRPSFLDRKDIIYRCLYLELGLERREPTAREGMRVGLAAKSGCSFDEAGWRWPRDNATEEFFLLYRGTESVQQDSPIRNTPLEMNKKVRVPALQSHPDSHQPTPREVATINPSRAHSLSYGLGLFAGVMQDSSATPYHYMSKPGMQAYALKILRREYCPVQSNNLLCCPSPPARHLFFVPPLTALSMLRGLGELFHPRSKVCIGPFIASSLSTRAHFVSGIFSCSYTALPPFLTTESKIVSHHFLPFLSTHLHPLS